MKRLLIILSIVATTLPAFTPVPALAVTRCCIVESAGKPYCQATSDPSCPGGASGVPCEEAYCPGGVKEIIRTCDCWCLDIAKGGYRKNGQAAQGDDISTPGTCPYLCNSVGHPVIGCYQNTETQACYCRDGEKIYNKDSVGSLLACQSICGSIKTTDGKAYQSMDHWGDIRGIAPPIPFSAVVPKLSIDIPGLTFPSALQPTSDGQFVYVPFLALYFAAIYKFTVGAAAVLAVIMIAVGGFIYLTAGGDPGKITKAKGIIVNAVVGLFIAVGSYTVLSLVNTDLVSFKSLRIEIVQRKEYNGDEGDSMADGENPNPPSWNENTFDCNNVPPAQGTVDPNTLVSYTCPGITVKEGKINTVAEMKDPLCAAGARAQAQGYTLVISDSYRPFAEQVAIWCGKTGDCASQHPDLKERRSFCAVPGFSNHGLGRAVDIYIEKGGKLLFTGGSKNQCGADKQAVETLAKIMYGDDPKWNRYDKEIWHFEYGTTLKNRSQTTTLPPGCSDASATPAKPATAGPASGTEGGLCNPAPTQCAAGLSCFGGICKK